ncbi:hypothetical protein ACVGVM_04510 [Pseudonocardia bannensis]|uniref:hypothetical protein n=1 Tax=Pseudonocardia bannensis TaxID=630973 RepID=UPI003F68B2D2
MHRDQPRTHVPAHDRRTVLRAGLIATAAVAAPAAMLTGSSAAAAGAPRANPFTLGVASGEPAPDGMVLWTRPRRRVP